MQVVHALAIGVGKSQSYRSNVAGTRKIEPQIEFLSVKRLVEFRPVRVRRRDPLVDFAKRILGGSRNVERICPVS